MKNEIMALNTWAVAIPRYSGGVVEWKSGELKELDRKTRMRGAFHPKRYLPRQKREKELISCEMCVKAKENNLAECTLGIQMRVRE